MAKLLILLLWMAWLIWKVNGSNSVQLITTYMNNGWTEEILACENASHVIEIHSVLERCPSSYPAFRNVLKRQKNAVIKLCNTHNSCNLSDTATTLELRASCIDEYQTILIYGNCIHKSTLVRMCSNTNVYTSSINIYGPDANEDSAPEQCECKLNADTEANLLIEIVTLYVGTLSILSFNDHEKNTEDNFRSALDDYSLEYKDIKNATIIFSTHGVTISGEDLHLHVMGEEKFIVSCVVSNDSVRFTTPLATEPMETTAVTISTAIPLGLLPGESTSDTIHETSDPGATTLSLLPGSTSDMIHKTSNNGKLDDNSTPSLIPAVVSCMVGILIITAIIGAICLRRRFRAKTEKSPSQPVYENTLAAREECADTHTTTAVDLSLIDISSTYLNRSNMTTREVQMEGAYENVSPNLDMGVGSGPISDNKDMHDEDNPREGHYIPLTTYENVPRNSEGNILTNEYATLKN